MEKINVAKILKDCPKGMELDCTMYDNVVFDGVSDDTSYPIDVLSDTMKLNLTKTGGYSNSPDAKCVIFPKGKTTWEGFVPPCKFKDGDIIADSYFDIICIFKGEGRIEGTVNYYCGINDSCVFFIKDVKNQDEHFGEIEGYNFATEEEKQKLFDAIKANGYKWNAETKTLEKLVVPKFKVGDRIRHRLTGEVYMVLFVLSNGYDGGVYDVAITNEIGKSIDIKEQDNYELAPNKFDITTLKPFNKVLVRHNSDNKWCGSFFSHIDADLLCHCFKYVTIAGKSYPMCVPYENNEHLLGTTNDCDEFYKTW